MRQPGIDVIGSRVGRRVLGMFLLAGLLPMLLMVYLSYLKVTDGIERGILVDLRENAKAIGMRIVDNWRDLSDSANRIALALDDDPVALNAALRTSSNSFEAIWVVRDAGRVEPITGGEIVEFDPAIVDRRHLNLGRAQLLRVDTGDSVQWLLLAATDGPVIDTGFVAFSLSGEAIWAPYEYLPHQTDYCIFGAGGERFYCTDADVVPPFGNLDGAQRSTLLEWQRGDRAMLSTAWQLFLMGESAFSSVDVVTSVDRHVTFSIVREFQTVFPLVVALMVILIAFFSFRIVRTNLVPVRKLQDAAEAYADGRLDRRVEISTGDEFEKLGNAFNQMAGSLSQQFSLLRAMSNVDRLIMSFASVDEICEVVLGHLSTQLQGKSVAISLQDEAQSMQERLLVWHDGRLESEQLVFDPRLTQRIRPKAGDDWYGEEALPAPLKKYFDDSGFRWFRNVPVSFSGQARGVIVLGAESRNEQSSDVYRHARDLARRIAVGVSNAEREQVLYQKTHYDDLTRLPNRQLLEDRLTQAITQLQAPQEKGAVLLLDLDHFKKINDLFGHSTGDIVLVQAAQRILTEAPDAFTVARLGDDEFAIVIPSMTATGDAGDFAAQVLSRLGQKFNVHGNEHIVGASIGISIFPDDGSDYEALIRNADAALNRVKDSGRGKFEFFSQRLNVESRRRLTLERGLRSAIENDELRVHYQPQVKLVDRSLHGAEALLRWKHPTLGDVSPAEFIPIAEQTNLIVDIGNWVVDRVCEDISRFVTAGLDCRTISINVSGRQLQDNRLVSVVDNALARHGVDAEMIKLEVTETAIAANVDNAVDTLARLQERGVHIAMDDFGTGFSSLSYLNEMPFDFLKIDQSFVRSIGGKRDVTNIIRAIITMAHELGKTIIAEGVETEQQEEFLKRYRVQIGQGYLYSKPLPRQEFERLIDDAAEQPALQAV